MQLKSAICKPFYHVAIKMLRTEGELRRQNTAKDTTALKETAFFLVACFCICISMNNLLVCKVLVHILKFINILVRGLKDI